jgi:hypothetical protein
MAQRLLASTHEGGLLPMTRVRSLWTAGCLAVAVLLSSPTAAHVQVGIQIGVPPPPPVLVAPPPLVVVPTTPAVRYAPAVSLDVFFYGGRYYAWQNGWFVAAQPGEAWTYIEPARVPRPVLIVPARYYKIPPGHLKKLYAGPHGPHRGPHGWYVGPDGHDRRHKHSHD